MPSLLFKPEQQVCPIEGERLQVLKTQNRIVKAIGIGTIRAHHTLLYCKRHPEAGLWRSKELDELVAPNSNVAYSVMVEIGKLRFLENRQIREIQSVLLDQHSLALSTSEIELLVHKFVFYLAAAHQESRELILAQIKHQGGYILHVDATCEADSPKLTSGLDSVSGFVLYSAKLNSENKEEAVGFLREIKEHFGAPHAIVSDLSRGIGAAIAEVFAGVSHYICHFHFLRAIGKMLFEKENNALRCALSKLGISGKLKESRKAMSQHFHELSMDVETYLAAPQQLGQNREATEMLTYYLIVWILDHASECNGYGFPFDQRYLHFYDRLKQAHGIIDEVKAYYPALTENDRVLWKLYHLIDKLVGDKALRKTVERYRTKLAVFSDLRYALADGPEKIKNGLAQTGKVDSLEQLQKIKVQACRFMSELEQKIQNAPEKMIKNQFTVVKERMEQYWEKLFAEPLIVNVDGQEKCIFVHRTNNFMENHFRQLAYGYRRIHGNRSVKRNLNNVPEELPLTENLKIPDYVKLIFGDEFHIAKRFSKVDVHKIRKKITEHHTQKQSLCSRKAKRIIRKPNFKNQLKAAFAAIAG